MDLLGPLFINKTLCIEAGITYKAEAHKTKGFAFRPGWHICREPVALTYLIGAVSGIR